MEFEWKVIGERKKTERLLGLEYGSEVASGLRMDITCIGKKDGREDECYEWGHGTPTGTIFESESE